MQTYQQRLIQNYYFDFESLWSKSEEKKIPVYDDKLVKLNFKSLWSKSEEKKVPVYDDKLVKLNFTYVAHKREKSFSAVIFNI